MNLQSNQINFSNTIDLAIFGSSELGVVIISIICKLNIQVKVVAMDESSIF